MLRNKHIPTELFIKNRKKLISQIDTGAIAIIFSNRTMPRNGDQSFNYRQSSDLFYLTGIPQEQTILLLFPEHPLKEMQEILFIKEADEKTIIWEGPTLDFNEAHKISGVTNILSVDKFDKIINTLIPKSTKAYIGLNKTLHEPFGIQSIGMDFSHKKQALFPEHKFENLDSIISDLRIIKEPEEIELLKTASNITSAAFIETLKRIKPNIKEYEIEAIITYEILKQGANGHSFLPIVASGKNACILHYIKNSSICKDGNLVLMDLGAEYACYAGDLSRTVPVNGKYSKRQKEIYNAVLSVFKAMKQEMVIGTTVEQLNKQTAQLIEEQCVKLGLFSMYQLKRQDAENPLYKKYFMHGLSHFIGLDVHDKGNKTIELKKGMVLSCEPGLYIPEEEIGIRIENDILIGEQAIDFMENTPLEIEEIETLMNY